jgi:hypothetical protein
VIRNGISQIGDPFHGLDWSVAKIPERDGMPRVVKAAAFPQARDGNVRANKRHGPSFPARTTASQK